MPSVMLRLLVCVLISGLPQEAIGQLNIQLQPIVEEWEGDIAVAVRQLDTGEEYFWRADVPQPTASLIKLAVMISAYRAADSGTLDLNRMLTLTEGDRVPGSGILTNHFSNGLSLSVRDAIRLMIRYSDNTATNLVIDQIGLPTTAATMQELGFPNTRLHAKVFRGDTSIAPDRSREFGLGSTTARETVDLLTRLHRGELASESSTRAMLDHLLQCDDDTKIAADLPPGTKFANKTGAVTASRTDAGIIFSPRGPIAICILTTRNADKSWKDDNAAHRMCARIGRITYDYFNPTSPSDPADPAALVLKNGATGDMVEMLQRTLNARLDPSPMLSADGDFGSVTEAAVRAFQESRSLPATGIVDQSVWQALGPLVMEEVIPPPEVVNAEILPKTAEEWVDAPPIVTCKAWTIVDAASGSTLWSHAADQQLDIASTTKIMTAWLVIHMAGDHPEILDEPLTMSARGDQTIGSTSALRAGESVSVREAIYGLMLPSGNDMSVALAEHFGGRMGAGSEAASADPLDLFVAAMNAEAVRLGMTQTHYQNPHGLTAPNHVSTAADLAILARAAIQNELFRTYVNTRQYGVTVQGPSGYTRNLLWRNTNQLLGIEGYSGIKTGTTDRAGACLVSTSQRDGRQLLLVVLGSAASESRYADSRNLYRWAWQQLQHP